MEISALVDKCEWPKSSLNPNLEPIHVLSQKCGGCPCYSSVEEMLSSFMGKDGECERAAKLDGVIVCTPHATHYTITQQLLQAKYPHPLCILLEKPMTTDVKEAKQLHELALEYEASSGGGFVMINHSADFRRQTKVARDAIVGSKAKIGKVRHITARMASPLAWLFNDPQNVEWNTPSAGMLGNGFAWGQISHLLAWIYHVTTGDDGGGDDGLQPMKVYCVMNHSETSGADISHSATITCNNNITFSLSGTCLLPGNEHGDPPKGKEIGIEIYGTEGAIFYSGNDHDPTSGKLKLHRNDAEGTVEVLCDTFLFENAIQGGRGPESLQSFLSACRRCRTGVGADTGGDGKHADKFYVGADTLVGLKSVQTLDAMYKSNASGNAEDVLFI